MAGLAGYGASRALPAPLGAVVAYGVLIFATGAIHLDGFLDGCDAFVASVSPERRREILKDPRHGTYAVVGMLLAGSATLTALATVPPKRLPATLAFAAALARGAAVCGAFVFPGARGDRSGSHYPASTPVLGALIASLGLAAVGGALIDRRAAALVPLAVISAFGCEAWIVKRIEGLAGDAYGFTIVLIETSLLVALAALVRE